MMEHTSAFGQTTVYMSQAEWDDILAFSNANTTAGPTKFKIPLGSTAATTLPWDNGTRPRSSLSPEERRRRKAKRKQAKTSRRRNR